MTTLARSRTTAMMGHSAGFSLLELLPSIAILSIVMSVMLGFMARVQKRFQGNAVVSESQQAARAAAEILSQEVGQAGCNPPFTTNKTISAPISANAGSQCVTLSDLSRISPGDWVSIDTGINNEIVQVGGTTHTGACAQAN